jgi:hypothetical protein
VSKHLRELTLATVAAVLAGCSQGATAPKAASPFKPAASIQELMQIQVDPAADAIWESVSAVTTAAGTEEHQPRTDAEWLALRHHAVTLIESANLLLIEGRPVVNAGKEVEDAHVEGVLGADRIQKAIADDRNTFIERAHALHAAGLRTLQAIEARDPAGIIEAGGEVQGVCESCHLKFWYPDARQT